MKELIKIITNIDFETYKDILDKLIYLKKIIKEEDRLYSLNLYTAEVKTSEYLSNYINRDIMPIGEDFLLDKLA